MLTMITGAAGGLGRAFAAECAARGHALLLTDISAAALETVRSGLVRQYGAKVYVRAGDLTRETDVTALAGYAYACGLRPDMLLNIAGVDHEGGFSSLDFGKIADIVRVNVEATLRVTHAVLSLREPGARTYIVFVSSLGAMYPMPLKAAYAASKRFLFDFAFALGEELRGDGVRVLTLCPGGLPTTEHARLAIDAQGLWGFLTENRLERVARRTIGRALAGKRRYTPGAVNRLFSVFAQIVPPSAAARLLHIRWRRAQSKWLPPAKRSG
jgi:short-subunit dehydrogenase